MKCVILAGGSGDALWPLSRRNYPKQFIHLHSGRSPFQEAVTRNLPFCDEFLILTNDKYENIVRSQLSQFQGLDYTCILEQRGRQTAPVLLLAALDVRDDEELLVVSCDHVIGEGDYNATILRAQRILKNEAQEGRQCIVAVGCRVDESANPGQHNFFDVYDDGQVEYIPANNTPSGHCDAGLGGSLPDSGMQHLADSGILLIRAGDYCSGIKKNKPQLYEACSKAYEAAVKDAQAGSILYGADICENIPPVTIGEAVYLPWSQQGKVKVVCADFAWQRLLSLDQVSGLWNEQKNTLLIESDDTRVINRGGHQLVVVNDVPGLLVVNDKDAVYISSREKSSDIKSIIAQSEQEELQPYFDEGDVFYTAWGCKETLTRSSDYVVKRLTILPGRSISMHMHKKRSEHWSVVSGTATIFLGGAEKEYKTGESIFVPAGMYHQITNSFARDLVLIEISMGESIGQRGADMIKDTAHTGSEDKSASLQKTAPVIKLLPVYKDYIWGGTELKEEFGYDTPLDIVAESWVLSAHRDGVSVALDGSGDKKGIPFDRYLENIGKEGLGWKSQPYERFPILVKWIDAKEPLSVQVHPADAYALEHENDYGKNEMWYIHKAKEGAFLYLGFEKDTSPAEIRQRIREGTLTEILHKVNVKQGDSLMVPAGLVHAIGPGIMILEVQQSSNATYRLYDYNRLDADHNPRPLHIDKALANLDYGKCTITPGPVGAWEELRGYKRILLQQCKYFSVSLLKIETEAELAMDMSTFYSLVFVEGGGSLFVESGEPESSVYTETNVKAGDSFFLPAGSRIVRIKGCCSLILSHT